jgi:adenine-specific DNA-methyltransferase
MNSVMPKPEPNETPSCYADRLGMWYATTASPEHKKSYGQYLTPKPVARYMARHFEVKEDVVWLLDPGAGSGILTCSVAEHLAGRKARPIRLNVEAYETDSDLALVIEASMAYLKQWLANYGIEFTSAVRTDDFVMTHSEALTNVLGDNPSLFTGNINVRNFDIVIANPPYFKIPKSDSRAKASNAIIHGQPNIYALFMAVSASLLKPGGQFVFITPRSFASGPYFRLFRERFFAKMRPVSVHVFESRTDAFKRDDILQENIILNAQREDDWPASHGHDRVSISSNAGCCDFIELKSLKVRSDLVLDMAGFDKILHVPTSHEELATMKIVRSWSNSLRKMGLEISTGPVVPFRAVPLLDEQGEGDEHAPLLWMQHVRAMKVQWPIAAIRKPQFIKLTDSALKILVRNKNYVLLRRFSAKEEHRRLVAAPYFSSLLESPWLGLENHLNYIHRPGGELTREEAMGLSVLYNCSMLDSYFRTLNGNTQVSATELRAIPLPNKQAILELGEMAMNLSDPLDKVDALVAEVLEPGRGAEATGEPRSPHTNFSQGIGKAAAGG